MYLANSHCPIYYILRPLSLKDRFDIIHSTLYTCWKHTLQRLILSGVSSMCIFQSVKVFLSYVFICVIG